MAYFLTCVHPYHDNELGMIERGHQVHDQLKIAQIVHEENRSHHFVKSYAAPNVEKWDWPPPHPDKLRKEKKDA